MTNTKMYLTAALALAVIGCTMLYYEYKSGPAQTVDYKLQDVHDYNGVAVIGDGSELWMHNSVGLYTRGGDTRIGAEFILAKNGIVLTDPVLVSVDLASCSRAHGNLRIHRTSIDTIEASKKWSDDGHTAGDSMGRALCSRYSSQHSILI